MKIRQLLKLEWDAIAGIIAAVLAIILHLLHIVDEHTILLILLALVGLLFINFMRHTREAELTAEQIHQTAHKINRIHAGLQIPDVVLIGPRHLRSAHERFLRNMSGETLWFNLCLSMYRTPELFDALLKPVIENPSVTSIQLILDHGQRSMWQESVSPLVRACDIHNKVKEPRWHPLGNPISFILGDTTDSGETEALLSFWGAPFMAQTLEMDVPRYILHVQKRSELLPLFEDLARNLPQA